MSEIPGKYRASRGEYGANKTERIAALVTAEAKEGLMAQAQSLHLSLGEYLERIGRGLLPRPSELSHLSESDYQSLVDQSVGESQPN
jgi:hypothetical protein